VEEGMLVQEVAALRRKRIFGEYPKEGLPQTDQPSPAANIPVPSFITQTFCATAEKELIYYLIKFGQHTLFTRSDETHGNSNISVAQYITAELRNDELEFQNLIYKNIFDEYSRLSLQQPQGLPNPSEESADLEHQKYFINHPDIAVAEVALELLDDRHPITIKHFRDAMEPEELQLGRAVPKAVLVYKSKITGEAYNALCANLEKAQATQDQEQIQTLMEQIRILLKIRNAFSRELKRLTL
jgi:DNA primase